MIQISLPCLHLSFTMLAPVISSLDEIYCMSFLSLCSVYLDLSIYLSIHMSVCLFVYLVRSNLPNVKQTSPHLTISLTHRFPLVQVSSKPEAPTSASVTDVTYNSAALSWTPGFDGGSEQTFYVEISPPTLSLAGRLEVTFSGQPTNYELKDLKPAQRYVVSVLAQNSLGFGDATEVTFETREFPLVGEC